MPIGGVVIQFFADSRGARRDIDKLTKSLGGVDSTARNVNSGISKLAKAGVAAVAVGAAMGAAALYDFAKAAAADWQESEKLARILGKVPGITDAMVKSNAAWIDSMEIATGFADTEFKDAIAKLAVATGDLTEAQTLAALAADVAAARNISLGDATNMLVKAVGGNTMMLKRNMPWLDANKDGTITLAEAVQGLTDKYGGAAAAAADNNPWVRIQAVWAQMKEALGQFILPLLEDLGTWFSDKKNQKALQGWIDKVGEFSYELGEKLVSAIQTTLIPFIEDTLLPAVESIATWFADPANKQAIADYAGNFVAMAQVIGDAMGTVVGWIQSVADAWNALPSWIQTAMKGLASASGGLVGFAGKLTDNAARIDNVTDAERLGIARKGDLPVPTKGNTTNVIITKTVVEKDEDSVAQALRIGRVVNAGR